jgi:hypothetical protein
MPIVTGLKPERLRLVPAPGLVPVLLQLHKLGNAGDQLGDPAGLVLGELVSMAATAPSGWA